MYWFYYIFFKLLFSLAKVEGCFAMKKLINHNSKGPNICLRSIYITMYALGRHIKRRSNVQITESTSKSNIFYLECTAKPKSAILATPFLTKMLAIFKSRWIIVFEARYKRPLNTSATIFLISCSLSGLLFLILDSRSPSLQSYVIM